MSFLYICFCLITTWSEERQMRNYVLCYRVFFVSVSICLSVSVSLSLSASLCLCLSVCLSVSLSLSLSLSLCLSLLLLLLLIAFIWRNSPLSSRLTALLSHVILNE